MQYVDQIEKYCGKRLFQTLKLILTRVWQMPYTFFPSACTSKSDSTMKGTCYTASECASKGGTTGGNCAAGRISVRIRNHKEFWTIKLRYK